MKDLLLIKSNFRSLVFIFLLFIISLEDLGLLVISSSLLELLKRVACNPPQCPQRLAISTCFCCMCANYLVTYPLLFSLPLLFAWFELVTPCSWERVECKKRETCLFLELVIKGSLTFTKTIFSFLPFSNVALSPCFSMRRLVFSNPNTYLCRPLNPTTPHTLFPKGFKYCGENGAFFFSALRGTFASLDSEVQ